jgi:DDE family transposase
MAGPRTRHDASLLGDRRSRRVNAGSSPAWLASRISCARCGRSRETAKRSDLAGWAEYGYCASHSRYFWGLRLHLITTVHGLPTGFALTGAKADERQVVLGIFEADPSLIAGRAGQILIGDKNYYGHDFEAALAGAGLTPRPGS